MTTNKPATSRNCSISTIQNYTSPPLVDIYANNSDGPVSIIIGSSVFLGWTAGGADSCIASGGWSGSEPVSGEKTIQNVVSPTTYTITCKNNAGSASDSVEVKVFPAPTVDIKANGFNALTINSGDSIILSWTSNNAVSCAATGSWSGSKPTNGSVTVNNITSQKVYTISCVGQGGSIPGGTAEDIVVVDLATKSNCAPSWSCQWSPCINGYKSIIPVDANNCGGTKDIISCITIVQSCAN